MHLEHVSLPAAAAVRPQSREMALSTAAAHRHTINEALRTTTSKRPRGPRPERRGVRRLALVKRSAW